MTQKFTKNISYSYKCHVKYDEFLVIRSQQYGLGLGLALDVSGLGLGLALNTPALAFAWPWAVLKVLGLGLGLVSCGLINITATN